MSFIREFRQKYSDVISQNLFAFIHQNNLVNWYRLINLSNDTILCTTAIGVECWPLSLVCVFSFHQSYNFSLYTIFIHEIQIISPHVGSRSFRLPDCYQAYCTHVQNSNNHCTICKQHPSSYGTEHVTKLMHGAWKSCTYFLLLCTL